MSRTAEMILAPLAAEVTADYNPVLWPDPVEYRKHIAAHRYLDSLAGDEPVEDVLAVTAYGLSVGLNRDALRVAPVYEESPFFVERCRLYDAWVAGLAAV